MLRDKSNSSSQTLILSALSFLIYSRRIKNTSYCKFQYFAISSISFDELDSMAHSSLFLFLNSLNFFFLGASTAKFVPSISIGKSIVSVTTIL